MMKPDQVGFGVTHSVGHDLTVLSDNEPVLQWYFMLYRVIVSIQQNQDSSPAVAIGMIAEFISDNSGDIVSKESEFVLNRTGIGNSERGVLASELNKAPHEINQLWIDGFACPVDLVDVIG